MPAVAVVRRTLVCSRPMSVQSEIVLVGAGRFGAVHAAKIALEPSTRLVAVCDPSLERARALAERWGAAAFGTLESALARHPGLEACVVVTPRPALAPVALTALRHGLHVLVEKPGASTASEFEAVAQAARGANRRLHVGYVERFHEGRPPESEWLVTRRSMGRELGAEEALADRLCHDLDAADRALGPGCEVVRAGRSGARLWLELAATRGRRGRLVLVSRAEDVRHWRTAGRRGDTRRPSWSDPLSAQWSAFAIACRGAEVSRLATPESSARVLRLLAHAEALLSAEHVHEVRAFP